MIVPREVFLKFYFDLLHHFREYTLDADEWKNKHNHQHKEDSKEWWFVEREVNGRNRYVSLEVVASAAIYDNQIFFRIYGYYGIEKIKKNELDWTIKELRALGAALKYMGRKIPQGITFIADTISKKEFEVIEARILFQYYLEDKHLNSDWPDFLIKYHQLNYEKLNEKMTNVLAPTGIDELQENSNAVEDSKIENSKSVVSLSKGQNITLNSQEAASILDEFREQKRIRFNEKQEKFLKDAQLQLPKILKFFFFNVYLGQLENAFSTFHPDYKPKDQENNLRHFQRKMNLSGATEITVFDISVIPNMRTIMGVSEDLFTAHCMVYGRFLPEKINAAYSISFKYSEGKWLITETKKEM